MADDNFDESIEREKLLRAGTLHWAHWLIVALSLVVTIAAWYISKEQVRQKLEERFLREAEQVIALVQERMELYENALWGGVALIDSKGGVINYEQWLRYANSLRLDETYPGVNGIGVIFNLQADALAAYLLRERASRPEFAIHPTHQEAEYWPITYIEPVHTNRKAVGLDMAFETNRYTAIKKSRDSGQAQLTGPIVLVQDAKKTPGFLFYAPFYRNGQKPGAVAARRAEIVGVTYAPFIMEKLMQGTLARQSRHVSIRIQDGDDLLFHDQSEQGQEQQPPLFEKSTTIDMYGRSWTFHIWSNADFQHASSSSQPYLILFGGITIDLLLFTLFVMLSRANRRAVSYADQITEALRINAEQLSKSNQDLEKFAYVASHDLKAPLRGIASVAEWMEEDLEQVFDKSKPIDDEVIASTKENLQHLKNRAARMERLLESILLYSKIEIYDDGVCDVDTEEVTKEIGELLNVGERFTITTGQLPKIRTEKVPFEMVLRNLLMNAMKHHDKANGSIHVSAGAHGDFVEFTVKDDGPGVDSEYKDEIFELFTTLKSRDEVEGSGMGLALVKRIVESKGGRAWLEPSADTVGAVFKFTWPQTES